MLKQIFAFLTALIVGLSIFFLAKNFSSSFQDCISHERSKEGQQTSKENNDSIVVVVISNARCTARFINEHNGAITALATIVIAAFTMTLWFATNQQAHLTRDSIELARADLIANYRPRLRVRNVVVDVADPGLVDKLGLFQPNQIVRGQLSHW
jgi:hypothetical protein